jgi:phosphoglycolate phosphatase
MPTAMPTPPTPKPTLLFDLDGTLTDSRPGITACIQYALVRLGVEAPVDLSWCLGPPLHESFTRLLASQERGQGGTLNKAPSKERVEEAVTLYRERFVEKGIFENAVYPEIEELLNELCARGFRLFLATSKPLIYAKQIVEHFGLARNFVRLYGSELDGRLSDKAQLIGTLLKSEAIAPSSAVMIGDRLHDIKGARANGVRNIGVLWGYGSREELFLAGANQFAAHPLDILELVK